MYSLQDYTYRLRGQPPRPTPKRSVLWYAVATAHPTDFRRSLAHALNAAVVASMPLCVAVIYDEIARIPVGRSTTPKAEIITAVTVAAKGGSSH